MDRRRLVLAGLAVAAVGPALAQTSPSAVPASPTTPMAPGAAGAPGNSGAPGGAMASNEMGPAEIEHMQKTLMVGSVALETSDIALKKAQKADVKQFAQFEHDEQTTVADIMKAMTNAGMQPPKPDAKSTAMIEKLQNAKAGADFDRDYIMGQIDGHKQLLAIQEDYLKSGRNREHVGATKLIRGMVKEHLVLLDEIHKGLMKG